MLYVIFEFWSAINLPGPPPPGLYELPQKIVKSIWQILVDYIIFFNQGTCFKYPGTPCCFGTPLFWDTLVLGHPCFKTPMFWDTLVLGHPCFWTPLILDTLVLGHPCFGTPLFWDTLVSGHPCFATPLFWDTLVLGHPCFGTLCCSDLSLSLSML